MYVQFLLSCFFKIGKNEVILIKRFNLWLPLELFSHIKIEAKRYNFSTTKMMVMLLEIGLDKFMKYERNDINDN